MMNGSVAFPPPDPVQQSPLRALYRLLSAAQRRRLYLTLVVMLLAALAELATISAVVPFLLSATGSQGAGPALPGGWAPVGGADGESRLLAAALVLGAAAAAAAIVQILLLAAVQRFVLTLGHDIGTAIFHRMLRQSYAYYVRRSTNEILVGIERTQFVVLGILLPAMQGIVSAVTALGIAILLFAIDPFAATLAAVSMVSVYLGIVVLTRERLKRNSAVMARTAKERMKVVREGLGGIRDILLEQSQELFEERFRELDDRWRRAQGVNQLFSRAPRFVVEAAGLVLVAILAVAMSRGEGGLVAAIPVLGAFALGAQRLLPLLQQSYLGWSSFKGNHQTLADVVALTQAPVAAATPRDRAVAPIPFAREIRFDAVSFRYDERGDVLRDLNLRIPRGTRLGVVGRSGSGKSTFLDLLMALLDPTSGEILVDGRALNDGTRAGWQAQVAHVPQSIYLADRSIATNIAFGEPEDRIDIERVREAARLVSISGFVDSLAEGYATQVGERGVRLSGGQRQRIGVARALYRRPGVLILDEATSALDEESEAALLESIATLGSDLTVVQVTHRIVNLSRCDLLIRIEDGRIVECGSFAELARRAGA